MKLGPFPAGALAMLTLGSVCVDGAQTSDRTRKPAGKWVLVAAIENQTGETIDDGWLVLAVEREVSDSPFLHVASQDRINDALAVLQKPANTPLDAATAKAVCQRDTAIKAVITGRIQKAGTGYAIAVQMTNPIDDHAIASGGEGPTLPIAIHHAALAIRKAQGESAASIAPSRDRLIHTPPQAALDLYARLLKDTRLVPPNLAQRERDAHALVESDSAFAYAHYRLSEIVWNERHDLQEQRPILEEAVRRKNTATPLERNLIDGAWHQWLAYSATKTADRLPELNLALACYEAALEIDPNSVQSTVNSVASDLGRPFDKPRYDAKLAEIRPLSFGVNAAEAMARMYRGDVTGAAPYARAAADASHDGAVPNRVAWIRLFPAFRAWAEGDVKRAANAVDAAWASSGDLSLWERVALGDQATLMSATLGRLHRAAEIAATMPNDQSYNWLEPNATVLELRGESDKLRTLVQPFLNKQPIKPGARFLVPAGLLAEARDITDSPKGPGKLTLTVQLASREGRWPDVIAAGQPYLDSHHAKDLDAEGFQNVEMIARALESLGNRSGAATLLEFYSSALRSAVLSDGYALMHMRLRLADLYRRDRRIAEAVKVEEELRTLLGVADPDFPLLIELRKQISK